MKHSILKSFALMFVLSLCIGTPAVAESGKGKNKKKATKKVEAKMMYRASIHQHHGDVVAVHFTKPSDAKVSITIKDASGKILHQETVKRHDKAIKKYLLDKFPAGSYTVTIRNGEETITKQITLD